MNEIKLSETGQLSNATSAFIEQDPQLKNILGDQHPYFSIEKAISGKAGFPLEKRQVLVNHLKQQYQPLNINSDSPVYKNIEDLANEGTYTVCTGQQLHLFMGPAFVIYKILAIVQYCETLKQKYPQNSFVPVYWLASEDHDFEEIQKTKIFNNEFVWETNQKGACGRFHVEDVPLLLKQIETTVNLNQESQQLIERFVSIYESSAHLSEASIRVIHSLFETYGLVCLDADSPDLKNLFISAIENDILSAANSPVFNETSAQLKAIGYKNQLHAREINFFYLLPQGRHRIEYIENEFHVLDTAIKFSRDAIISEIRNRPQNFSPNAVLRPLYQECILPNVCYLGGNAEVNYWLQIHNLFAINNITAPKLELRPSVWIIPHKIEDWLKKHDINPLKMLITQEASRLIHLIVQKDISLQAYITRFNALRTEVQDIGFQSHTPDLNKLLEAGKAYENSLKDLQKKIKEKEREKHEKSLQKLEDIFYNYFDINSLQERTTSSLELLIKHQNVVFNVKNQCNLKPANACLLID